jgi:hypothetical protein
MLVTENRVNMRMSGLFIFNILCYILDMSNVSVTNIPQLAGFFLESNIIIKFSFASMNMKWLNGRILGKSNYKPDFVEVPFCSYRHHLTPCDCYI